jgi:hypothetical protein
MSEQVQSDRPANILAPVLIQAQKQLETFTQAQSELAGKAVDISRYWADRGRFEASTASEFVSKLAASHSIPEAVAAWQDWSRSRLERMVDDGKHFAADLQDVMKTATNSLPKNDA